MSIIQNISVVNNRWINRNGKTILVCILLAVCVFLVFGQVGKFNFIRYDDELYVTNNPHIADGVSIRGMTWALTTFAGGNWHPLTWFSLLLDWECFGMDAGGYHLMNMTIHLLSGFLLFFIFNRMTGHFWRSALVAALFLIHPLHVESVASVAGRKDVLSGLFWMLTIWAYLLYAVKPQAGRYLSVILLFSLALMSKPTVVTLPFVLLLLDHWPLGRIHSSLQGHLPGVKRLFPEKVYGACIGIRFAQATIFRLVLEKVPLVILSSLTLLLTFKAQREAGAISSFLHLPLGHRLANGLFSYVRYLGKAIYPSDMSFFYPYPFNGPDWSIVAGGAFLIVICIWVRCRMNSKPYLAIGWLWFLGVLIPVIGIIQVGSQAMADRYTYLPLIGLSVMVVWGSGELLRESARFKILYALFWGLFLCCLMLVSFNQTRYWRDSLTLFKHATEVTNKNFVAHNNWGAVLMEQKSYTQAAGHFREALRIKPNYAQAKNNLGEIMAIQGEYSEAEALFRETIRIKPDYDRAIRNLCDLLQRMGKNGEAVLCYRKALLLRPDDPELLNNLAVALGSMGKREEAIFLLQTALRLKPEGGDASKNLGVLTGEVPAADER